MKQNEYHATFNILKLVEVICYFTFCLKDICKASPVQGQSFLGLHIIADKLHGEQEGTFLQNTTEVIHGKITCMSKHVLSLVQTVSLRLQ